MWIKGVQTTFISSPSHSLQCWFWVKPKLFCCGLAVRLHNGPSFLKNQRLWIQVSEYRYRFLGNPQRCEITCTQHRWLQSVVVLCLSEKMNNSNNGRQQSAVCAPHFFKPTSSSVQTIDFEFTILNVTDFILETACTFCCLLHISAARFTIINIFTR